MKLTLLLGMVLVACGDTATSAPDAADAATAPDGDAVAETSTEVTADAGDDVGLTDLVDLDGATATDADSGAEVTPDAASDIAGDAAQDVATDGEVSAPTLDPWNPDVLHEVVLTMAPADLAALRRQTRTLFDVVGPTCLAEPAGDAFTWFEADVVVDGLSASRVGVKKKGFLGSLDNFRPSLRIETDHYVPGQRLGGIEHLTLNNGRQDPSRLKQCLAYQVFAAAGIPSPRCSFAHVVINGEDLGLFANVEPLKKAFVKDHFAPPTDATGQLWEGALSDFRSDWLGTFESKIDSAPQSTAPLEAVVKTLALPDDTLLDGLDKVLDLEQFMTFWATEVLVAHWDGYSGNTNNFYVFHDADGRLRFIPWGVDGTFVDLVARGGSPDTPTSVMAVGALAQRLYALPEGRTRYHAALKRVMTEAWNEAELIDRIAAWDALTWEAREPGSGEAGSAGVAELKQFVQRRRGELEAELQKPPDGPEGLRDAPCLHEAGLVTGSFTTTWGTLGVDNLFSTGTSTLALTSSELPQLSYDLYGAKAGEDTVELPGVAQVVTAARVVGAGYIIIVLQTPLPLAAGSRPVDQTTTTATVYYLDPNGQGQLIGFLGESDIVFEAADDSDGAAVKGSFSLTLFII